jgi:glyoxylase I family protein
MSLHVHHSAVTVADLGASLRFYRDGLGLELMMDAPFEGPWRELFDGPADRLRSVMLGDPGHPDAGIVELVEFDGGAAAPGGTGEPGASGFLLLSFYVDVDATLQRLAGAGFADHRRITLETPHGELAMASICDPDGVLIELVDARIAQQVTG